MPISCSATFAHGPVGGDASLLDVPSISRV